MPLQTAHVVWVTTIIAIAVFAGMMSGAKETSTLAIMALGLLHIGMFGKKGIIAVVAATLVYWPRLTQLTGHILGRMSVFDIGAIVGVVLVLYRSLMTHGRMRLPSASFMVAMVGVIGTRTLSFLLSPYQTPDMLYNVLGFAEHFLVVVAWVNLVGGYKTLSTLVKVIVCLTFLETALAYWQIIMSHGTLRGVGLASTRGVYEFQILAFLLKLSYAQEQKGFSRLLSLVGALFLAGGVVVTLTRTAWLQLLVAAATYVVLYYRRSPRLIVGSITVLAALAAVIWWAEPFWPQMSIRLQELRTLSGGSISVRLSLWSTAWQAFLDRPFVGIGPGAFARQEPVLLARYGQSIPEYLQGISVHNTVLDVLVETGLLGLVGYAIYAWSILECLLRAANDARAETGSGEGLAKPLRVCTAVTAFSLIVTNFYGQGSFSSPYGSTILGILFASEFIRNRQTKAWTGGRSGGDSRSSGLEGAWSNFD